MLVNEAVFKPTTDLFAKFEDCIQFYDNLVVELGGFKVRWYPSTVTDNPSSWMVVSIADRY